ncbi:hypothetical protein AOG55_04745 [Acidiplasma cupricumulans]|uniref:CN hydrolase domain-containing protein n=4 Tax=Ferroplasmaceae TaxID=90142 RepID=A0A0Q0RKZ8_9ARCH|nr:hypothetical protein AOG54_00800 [Acidiplasma aeolicum]KQB36178.1 hypothetical protein AOG55_04745 [Acidiplasma cupricumulans]
MYKMPEIGASIIQLKRTDKNSAHDNAVNSLKNVNSEIILFPEKWITEKLTMEEALSIIEDLGTENIPYFIPGSFSIQTDAGLFNRSFFVHYGKIAGYQDKIMLYGNEKIHYNSGNIITIFSHNDLKFGIAVCYDIDFPYYMKILAGNGCDIVLNPSLIGHDFNVEWHMYIKIRSLENRMPVMSANSISDPYLGESIMAVPFGFKNGFRIRTKIEKYKNIEDVINTEDYRDGRNKRFMEDPGKYAGPESKIIKF